MVGSPGGVQIPGKDLTGRWRCKRDSLEQRLIIVLSTNTVSSQHSFDSVVGILFACSGEKEPNVDDFDTPRLVESLSATKCWPACFYAEGFKSHFLVERMVQG